VKIYSSWGAGKTSRKPKRTVLKAKIRWDIIGLQDPKLMAATPSMEDIRSQIISMANQRLEAPLHSAEKTAPRKPSPKPSADVQASALKRRRGGTQ